MKTYIAFLAVAGICISCSKSHLNPRTLQGTWIFSAQNSRSYAYPSILTQNAIIFTSDRYSDSDSMSLIFDNNGNYSYSNYTLPVDHGMYTIVNDSFLVIKPDTSDFIKFTFTLPVLYSYSGPTPPVVPVYSDFVFSNDTIAFNVSYDNHLLALGTKWIAKSNAPIAPFNDTLFLNSSSIYFTRK